MILKMLYKYKQMYKLLNITLPVYVATSLEE